jgi:conjugal transfer pilus assembly protein TraW
MLHLAFSPFVLADEENAFFIREMIKQQPDIKSMQLPDWLKNQPAQLSPVFEQLLRDGNDRLSAKGYASNMEQLRSAKPPAQGRWIFVSFSMPPNEMKAAAEEAAATQSILVFRGVEKGGDTGTITRKLYATVKDMKPVPAAVIDPLLYTRFQVASVPTMIETNVKGETRIARGLPGFNWLSKQDTGDSGQKGPVFGIAEPDIIEEMQRRMEEFDWAKEKQHAIDNFWAHQQDSVNLPVANKNRERLIDTSIVSTQDIFHPDGRLIFKKGQKINPQALLPMRHVYVLFDATDKEQVKITKKVGDDFLSRQNPVVYLFSKINTEKGWDHYNRTTELLNAPIYKLTQAIVDRFQVQALPSVIQGKGASILVREIDPRGLN